MLIMMIAIPTMYHILFGSNTKLCPLLYTSGNTCSTIHDNHDLMLDFNKTYNQQNSVHFSYNNVINDIFYKPTSIFIILTGKYDDCDKVKCLLNNHKLYLHGECFPRFSTILFRTDYDFDPEFMVAYPLDYYKKYNNLTVLGMDVNRAYLSFSYV